nr:MAG: hypothetical protein [Microvirus sp.]
MKFRRKRSFRRVHARSGSGRRTKRLRSYGVSRGGIRL